MTVSLYKKLSIGQMIAISYKMEVWLLSEQKYPSEINNNF